MGSSADKGKGTHGGGGGGGGDSGSGNDAANNGVLRAVRKRERDPRNQKKTRGLRDLI